MRQQKRRIKFLERKEIERLILSIKPRGYRGTRDRALMEVLFSTGMRIHEALAITVDEMRIVLDEENPDGRGGQLLHGGRCDCGILILRFFWFSDLE